MSITAETAKAHENDPAVTCCRFEAGTVIEPSNLEDPNILPDLEDSGLLEMPSNGLKIGEVLGAKLKETVDALTPLTADMLEGVREIREEVAEVAAADSHKVVDMAFEAQPFPMSTGASVKIRIGEGKNIDLEIPIGVASNMGFISRENAQLDSVQADSFAEAAAAAEIPEAREMRRLVKKHFKIDKVELSDETRIYGTTLYIRKDICAEAVASEELVTDLKIDIITPEKYDTYSETIMDIQPIAVKEEGELGSGVTRVLDGVIMMVTGTDENGVQIGEFGSSEGDLDKNIMWGRPGAPDYGDIFIKTQVTVKAGTNMERPGPLAAHKATDIITQEIRDVLKEAKDVAVADTEELVQYRRPGKKKVVVVKEIMGQGAMHDNLILPVEPVGTIGAKPNVDLGNVPVMLSPLEVLDGGIHALTCIGPASKENSRHYWREPLVMKAMKDEEIDLAGVIFIGSPQVNSEKFYVSKRLGMMVEGMDVDGAIITTEGFGNNHIDFASHHEQIGMRDVAVVGCSFSAVQGALVVGNEYMKYMVDNNKSKQGIENEILSNNTLCEEDAVRALAMLKAVMAGEEVKPAERKWNANVKLNNIEMIEKETGKKVDILENEQVLEKSKKRREIYEKEEVR
ncbi:D-proline reductase (dithiol) PrdA [Peptoclostridium litorale DSM 5388]|uniref:D-proline reductase proprotein PrdA n=1 Tax=Peptoclostridium litorale DSM 5388 TaxID=1121324 RepID=A0A069RM68_PEPLI|nr:D-proline reductase (dithiol) proprotein PrdA [Peptoclostridium litorale]KDR93870.1 D-proline reductase proprotein PrdA [Peptoclostridium litorale DSM 5388]KDR95297.1 D-proline reductase proprotein PrdA [Peptoclostridium litorale DSM 5388]SIN87539.1 D-proline reductase (dithiol) PrdA [Peptoclostridium litorale DSM 5388]